MGPLKSHSQRVVGGGVIKAKARLRLVALGCKSCF